MGELSEAPIKVAVCLSGQTRTIEKCVDSLVEHIITPLNADVFWHFWTDSIVPIPLHRTWYKLNEAPKWPDFDDKLALDVFNKLKPKSFIVQPQVSFDEAFYSQNCTQENSRMQSMTFQHPLSMFYSILASNACKSYWEKKTNTTYDVVIRCRPDLKFNKPIDDKIIFSSGGNIHIPIENGYGGYNDMFAIGGRGEMNYYANCFNEVKKIFESGTNFHPESILKKHLSNGGFNVIHFESNFELMR